MGKKIKKASFWVKRRSHLPILVIGTIIITVLYFNEDTSWTRSMEYDKQISELKAEIKDERDSMEYYRRCRKSIEGGTANLEYMAREQFHMQRPTEDVYLLTESDSNE